MTASEEVVKACRENGFKVVIKPPVHFAEIGMQLPFGRAFSSGKAILPAISRSLHDTLVAAEKLIPQFSDAAAAGIEPRHLNNPTGLPDSEAIAALPVYPTLPDDWQNVDVGDLVLITGEAESGWWEAIVIQRVQQILTLRLRDEPKQGSFIRHRLAVALLNPKQTPRRTAITAPS